MRFKSRFPCPTAFPTTSGSVQAIKRGGECFILGLASRGELGRRKPVVPIHGSPRDISGADAATSTDVYKWVQESLAGIHFFHQRGYIHRDLKEANIFLDKDQNTVIGDVGLAVKARGSTHGQCGTPVYIKVT